MLKCSRCHYTWTPRIKGRMPRACPDCYRRFDKKHPAVKMIEDKVHGGETMSTTEAGDLTADERCEAVVFRGNYGFGHRCPRKVYGTIVKSGAKLCHLHYSRTLAEKPVTLAKEAHHA